MALRCVEGQSAYKRRPVTSDVFHIAQRIKDINPGYFIMFNTESQAFEVHLPQPWGSKYSTLECTLPFPDLDYRTLHHVRKYQSSRFDETVREMDRSNEKLEQTVMDTALDRSNYKMVNAIRWADNHPSQDGAPVPKELISE